MDIITDIKFVMFAWTVVTCILQWYIGYRLLAGVVRQNQKDIRELEEKYETDKKERTDLLIKVSNDVAHIKGQLDSDNKIIKILEKVINN